MNYYDDITQIINKMKFEYDSINRGFKDKSRELDVHIKKIDEVLISKEEKKLDFEVIEVLQESRRGILDYKEQIGETLITLDDSLNEVEEIKSLIEKLREKKDIHKLKQGIKLLDIQEEERRRVARELHDSTVQNLTSLIYRTELCTKFLDTDTTRVRLELQVMIVSLKSIIEEMRQIIYDLRPGKLEPESFDKYIQKYIQELNVQYANIEFSVFIKGKIKPIAGVYFDGLVRIIKEACQNAIKYAKASNIDVTMEYGATGVKIAINDNGIGFEWEKYEQEHKNKFGISIMNERTELMNGRFEINSVKGKGTTIVVEVPKCLTGVM